MTNNTPLNHEALTGFDTPGVGAFDLSFGVCAANLDDTRDDYCGHAVKNTGHIADTHEEARYGKPYLLIDKDRGFVYLRWACNRHRQAFISDHTARWWVYAVDMDRMCHLMNPPTEEWTAIVKVDATNGMSKMGVAAMLEGILRHGAEQYADAFGTRVTTVDEKPA